MNLRKCIVGFDFGTTSLSVVVFNIEEIYIEKILNYNTNAYIPFVDDLKKEQSLDIISGFFRKAIDEIAQIPDVEIIGYSFTGQMHGIIGLNERGEAITNLVTWQDRSGDILIPSGSTILQEIRRATAVNTVVNGYGIVTLYKWLKYDKRTDIYSFCTLPDYFARQLARKKEVVVEITPSMAHSIGLYDLYTNQWQTLLISKIGLQNIVFPRIVAESYVIGYKKSQKQGVPVFCAIGDNQASFEGSVVDKQQTILLNVGTGTQLSFLVAKSEIHKYDKYADGFETQIRPYDDAHYLLATSFLNGGSVYKSLFNFFKDVAQNLFGLTDIDENFLWKQMMTLGEKAQLKENPLVVNPLLEGQRKDPSVGGTISNLHTANFTSGYFVTGFLKGLAEYYKTGLYPELASSISSICGSGNGLKRNPLFCDIIQSTFGYPLQLTSYNEEAALGAVVNTYSVITKSEGHSILKKLNSQKMDKSVNSIHSKKSEERFLNKI